MKKVEIKSFVYQFNENEISKIHQCLRYCWHRYNKHSESGIHKAIKLIELEELLESFKYADQNLPQL